MRPTAKVVSIYEGDFYGYGTSKLEGLQYLNISFASSG